MALPTLEQQAVQRMELFARLGMCRPHMPTTMVTLGPTTTAGLLGVLIRLVPGATLWTVVRNGSTVILGHVGSVI